MPTIPVIVERGNEPQPGTLGMLTTTTQLKQIDMDKMRHSFSTLSEQLSTLLQDIKQVGQFRLKEVQLQVEVTAEGGVALIGVAKAGVSGAITLTFAL